MSEDKTLREIAISDDAFTKLPEGFCEGLKKNEKVVLAPMPKEKIHALKMKALAMPGMIGIIIAEMSQNADTPSKKQLEEIKKDFEIRELQPTDIKAIYDKPKTKHREMYVPRVIGKPNSKKQGR